MKYAGKLTPLDNVIRKMPREYANDIQRELTALKRVMKGKPRFRDVSDILIDIQTRLEDDYRSDPSEFRARSKWNIQIADAVKQIYQEQTGQKWANLVMGHLKKTANDKPHTRKHIVPLLKQAGGSFGISKFFLNVEFTSHGSIKINPDFIIVGADRASNLAGLADALIQQFNMNAAKLISVINGMGIETIGSGWKPAPAHWFNVTGLAKDKIMLTPGSMGKDGILTIYPKGGAASFDQLDVKSAIQGVFRGYMFNFMK